MNVSKPPFSAVSSSQSIVSMARSCDTPSLSRTSTESARTTTISPFSMNWTRRVWARNAGTADAMNASSSPRPTTSGHSRRAPTSTSGSSSAIATNAK